MAKLNKQLAQQAQEQAEDWDGGYSVVQPGIYLCKLNDVDTTRSGPAGPYWNWEYETVGVHDEPKGKRFWDITSLSEKAIGRLGKVFEAFGASTEADTDDLIGSVVAVEVKIGTISKGDRAGEQRNEVVSLHPAEAHAWFHEYEEQTSTAAAADDF